MPITSVEKDLDALTMTVTADFPVSQQQLWNAYADPRVIEKFWGPETYPATFSRHDMATGGRSAYSMTGPDGDVSSGYWEFLDVQAPDSFEVIDGFAKPDGEPNTDMPSMRMTFVFSTTDRGSRLVNTTWFGSADELEKLLSMGMEEGMRSAMSQIDAVLADLTEFAAGRGTQAQILSDTQVRITRVINGTVEQVWRAHHEPELVKRWLKGPDGWEMTNVVMADRVGDSFRQEWAPTPGGPYDGAEAFGFEGELLAIDPHYREVTTERMIGMEGPSNTNELTLVPVEGGGTLLSLLITYPSAEVRDMVLGTGMTDGMEASYARLESELVPA